MRMCENVSSTCSCPAARPWCNVASATTLFSLIPAVTHNGLVVHQWTVMVTLPSPGLRSHGIAGACWPHSSGPGAGPPGVAKSRVRLGRLALKAVPFPENHTEGVSGAEGGH